MSLDSNGVMQFFNVPWDMGYRNLRYFASKAERDAWFDARVNEVYPNADGETITVELGSPIRPNLPYRVNKGWDARHNANYCRFWNKEYPQGEWQYAFITDVVYANAHACNIYIALDSWVNNIERMNIQSCFIERHHTADGAITDVPEPISINHYIYKGNGFLGSIGASMIYCLFATKPPLKGVELECSIDGRAYPLYLRATDSYAEIQNLVSGYEESQSASLDDIITVMAVPSQYVAINSSSSIAFINQTATASRQKPSYEPKNKKCNRYPFQYCQVVDFQSGQRTYRWEDGSGDELKFNIHGGAGLSPIMELLPNFENSELLYIDNLAHNFGFTVGFSGSGANDWMARNGAQIRAQEQTTFLQGAMSVGMGAISGAITGGIAPVLGGVASAFTSTANYEISKGVQYAQAQQVKNPAILPDGAMAYLGKSYHFGFYSFSIYPSNTELRELDSYFERYGYAYMRIGKPNPNNHTPYYFCKTNGAIVTGACPQRDRENIMQALDRGVTFWHTDTFNYSI